MQFPCEQYLLGCLPPDFPVAALSIISECLQSFSPTECDRFKQHTRNLQQHCYSVLALVGYHHGVFYLLCSKTKTTTTLGEEKQNCKRDEQGDTCVIKAFELPNSFDTLQQLANAVTIMKQAQQIRNKPETLSSPTYLASCEIVNLETLDGQLMTKPRKGVVCVYSCCPYAPDGTLKDFLEVQFKSQVKTKTPEQQILRWLLCMTKALFALHSSGIVHQTIRPRVFLLQPDGQLLLTEMGVGLLIEPPMSDECRGTGGRDKHYVSPENEVSRRQDEEEDEDEDDDTKCAGDVWSLGIILAELLTGTRSEMRGKTIEHFIATKLLGQVYSPQILQLLQEMLQPDPAKRITARSAFSQVQSMLNP